MSKRPSPARRRGIPGVVQGEASDVASSTPQPDAVEFLAAEDGSTHTEEVVPHPTSDDDEIAGAHDGRDGVHAVPSVTFTWVSVDYASFLASKIAQPPESGVEPGDCHPSLYPFQAALVRWAVRRGRAALFADCGMGKTRMQIEWARQIGRRTLILAPLGVAAQTIAEAAAIGIDVRYAEQGGDIVITNYERLHKVRPEDFGALVADESSLLKSVDGKIRGKLLNEWTAVPFRLACTATPAPNDIAELANHAEFLGIMSRAEMLASFFIHDDRDWRLKGHAEARFFEWMATWAVYIRRPSDIGFDDAGFDLPPLTIRANVVPVELRPEGQLFPHLASGIQGRTAARRQSLDGRIVAALEELTGNNDQWVVWAGLNAEQDGLAAELGDDCVSIQGSDPEHVKIEREAAWRRGDVRILVTKGAIFGHGMNWQNCHRMLFLGIGDSYETYYQSLRRCHRFGQTQPVEAVIVTSDAEGAVVSNVQRKEREAERTAASVIEHMRIFETAAVQEARRETVDYTTDDAEGDGWRLMLGDSVERLREVADGSVGLSVFSPPFASLYTYSASDRDLGNASDYPTFFLHFAYVIRELLRATMPARRACVHVQQVSTTKATHGVIGWRDFRADTVAAFTREGWVYDGEVVIDKDPQAQAIRTKSLALMFATKNRDSAWSRPAMADYILLFRKPGDNPEPIKNDVSNDEWISWARPVWYGIRETETLQSAVAREEKDEKHIAPLQLETVERCVRLWSNRGDLVCSPFAGIGTEGYVALRHGRRFVGVELKGSYWKQAVKNLRGAKSQTSLLDVIDAAS